MSFPDRHGSAARAGRFHRRPADRRRRRVPDQRRPGSTLLRRRARPRPRVRGLAHSRLKGSKNNDDSILLLAGHGPHARCRLLARALVGELAATAPAERAWCWSAVGVAGTRTPMATAQSTPSCAPSTTRLRGCSPRPSSCSPTTCTPAATATPPPPPSPSASGTPGRGPEHPPIPVGRCMTTCSRPAWLPTSTPSTGLVSDREIDVAAVAPLDGVSPDSMEPEGDDARTHARGRMMDAYNP